MASQQLEVKALLLIELALATVSKKRARFLDVLGKLRNASVTPDEVRSAIQFISDTEKIPVSELIPTSGTKTKAGCCC